MNVDLALVVGATALVVVGMLAWVRVQQQAAVDRLDDRVAHLTAAVSLLTDTVEGGLRDTAIEIGRLAAGPAPRASSARATTKRRITSAARRGRSLPDIAAQEQLSESEVRLHLQLDKARKGGADHAALR